MRKLRWVVACLAALATVSCLGGATAAADTAQTGAIGGEVIDGTGNPVAAVVVSVTDASGVGYSSTTDAGGQFVLAGLPAPAGYDVVVTPPPGYEPQTIRGVQVEPQSETAIVAQLALLPGSVTGRVRDEHGRLLAGMQVQLRSLQTNQLAGIATTGSGGVYTLSGLSPGSYAPQVEDGRTTVGGRPVQVATGQTVTDDVELGPPQVPAGAAAHNAARDLAFLNAERLANGLPGGIVLNPRWSTECAAHDAYERSNRGLTHVEQHGKPGYSPGGAWAGGSSVLAAGAWTRGGNPFETAPGHLIQLYSPSLDVIGIDDSHGLQCATTWPGIQRSWAVDTVFTYPGNGVRGVPPSESADEFPFVPSQFVGIPARRTTGRELFVYLNRAGQPGQAQVRILSASLTGRRGPVAIRTVDNTTPTVGPYLSGGILIPVRPLAPRTTYTARVTLADGAAAISHTWSFTTARAP